MQTELDTETKRGFYEQLLQLLTKSPQVAVWLVLIIGAYTVYSDNRNFILEQNEVLKQINQTQIQMQVELREVNTRLQQLESKIK